jgi:hypothetical protein
VAVAVVGRDREHSARHDLGDRDVADGVGHLVLIYGI